MAKKAAPKKKAKPSIFSRGTPKIPGKLNGSVLVEWIISEATAEDLSYLAFISAMYLNERFLEHRLAKKR